jgi:hypothetical protein
MAPRRKPIRNGRASFSSRNGDGPRRGLTVKRCKRSSLLYSGRACSWQASSRSRYGLRVTNRPFWSSSNAWPRHGVDGDRRFIEGLLSDDWTVIDQAGRVLSKQQVLGETFTSTERRIEAMVVDDVKVRLLGGAAVATGRTRATGSYRGQSATVTLRFTDVFQFRDGRWQIVASPGTTVAQ